MFYLSVEQIGNNILERYIDDNGEEHQRKVPYEPVFYNHNPNGEYKDIYGKPVTEKRFDNIYESKQWRKKMSNTGLEVLGMDDLPLQYLHYTYPEQIKPDISKIRVAVLDIEVYSNEGFPEPSKSLYGITSLTHYDSVDDKFYVFSTKDWTPEDSELPKSMVDRVKFFKCENERKMLALYLKFWQKKTPAAVTGWNSEGFDIPYIMNRVQRLWGEGAHSRFSPWGKVNMREVPTKQGVKEVFTIMGVSSIDYMEIYKKFTFKNQPSYKLDYIASVELKDNKLEFDGSLAELWVTDPQKYIDYNIKDVDIINRLDKIKKLFNLVFELSYYAKINYDSVMSPLKTWDAIIYNSLQSDGIIIPENKKSQKTEYEGAYVKIPVPNLYKWILSFDLTSLYPHLIMQYNISPETIIDMINPYKLEEYVEGVAEVEHGGYSLAPNGMRYTKKKLGIIPQEIEKVFLQRKHHKKLKFEAGEKAEEFKQRGDEEQSAKWKDIKVAEDISQQVRKVLINSLYGALGNQWFRYFDIRNAEAITLGGQLSIKWIARKLNEFLNEKLDTTKVDYVVYIDTDSVYINMEQFVNTILSKKGVTEEDVGELKIVDMLDKYASTKMEAFIGESYEELANYMNAYKQKMFMDREVIASSGLWTAKKRYALRVWDSEGERSYDDDGNVIPSLKIMGLETQRSSTPPIVSDALEKCIEYILLSDEKGLQEFHDDFYKRYKGAKYQEISEVSSANNLEKYRERPNNWIPGKGCPRHVKGVYLYNKLADNYPNIDPIKEGDKIAHVELVEPNEYGYGVISYPSGEAIPKEFGVDIYKLLNFNHMFDKTFIKPLSALSNASGIQYKYKPTLGFMF